jgi:O-succinylbenzoic acid--CoA ligase
MTRPLHAISATDSTGLLVPLRAALSGEGPAILPLPSADAAERAATAHLVSVPLPIALVIETSGSTDAPKQVMLGTDALLASAAATSVALGGPGQWLLALPAHYIAGVQVLVRSIAAGTTPVVMPPGHFDPVLFAATAALLTEPLRYTSLVPVQLARLVDAAESDRSVLEALRRFTAILVGGQAVPPVLVDRARGLGVRVVRTYGSSETAGGCVYDGVPIGNTRARISMIDGSAQLELSGSVLAEGYLGDPDRTADRFISEHGVRWYRTGDLGEVNAETGKVAVLGRADNVIISGGEKVSLDAVERTVRSLSGFEEAVVVPGDDPIWGQVPVLVVSAGRRVPTLHAAREAVASVLGNTARPARLVTVPVMPLLTSGKPDRQALRGL